MKMHLPISTLLLAALIAVGLHAPTSARPAPPFSLHGLKVNRSVQQHLDQAERARGDAQLAELWKAARLAQRLRDRDGCRLALFRILNYARMQAEVEQGLAAQRVFSEAEAFAAESRTGSFLLYALLGAHWHVAHQRFDRETMAVLEPRIAALEAQPASGPLEVALRISFRGTVTARTRGDVLTALRKSLSTAERAPQGYFQKLLVAHLSSVLARQLLPADPSGPKADAEARRLFQRAFTIWEHTGPLTWDYYHSNNALGVYLLRAGRSAEGRNLLRRTLSVRRRYARSPLDVALDANLIGNEVLRLREERNLDFAEEMFTTGLKIGQASAVVTLEHADSLKGLGAVARQRGNGALSRAFLDRALQLYGQIRPSLSHARALVEMAEHVRGDRLRFRDLHERARAIALGLEVFSPETAGLNTQLAWNAYSLGDFAEAKKAALRSLEILRRIGMESEGSPSACLGAIAVEHGDLNTARRLLEISLAEREKASPNSPLSLVLPLQRLANVAIEQNDLVAADRILRRLDSIAQDTSGADKDPSTAHDLGRLAFRRGNLKLAREHLERAVRLQRTLNPSSRRIGRSLEVLAAISDEVGDREQALSQAREALKNFDSQEDPGLFCPQLLRLLSRLVVDQTEAESYLIRAVGQENEVRSLLPEKPAQVAEPAILPKVRFLMDEDPLVSGDSIDLQMVVLSPIPPARYRIWINGRPLGSFDLPKADEKGRLLDKGRLLEKGDALGEGGVFEKGRLLEKGEDRENLAKDLPEDLAALVKKPHYAHFLQITRTAPIEDTDGEFLRIAVQVETTGGSVSGRQILRLRRPQAEAQRGSLRVLTVGIGDYAMLPKLNYAAADAVSLADAFRGQAGLETGTSLYRGADVRMLVNADATLTRIREALDQLAADTRPGDTVVLALSGHGIAVRRPAVDLAKLPLEAMMAMKPTPTQTYFAPVRFDPENSAGTGLPWSEIVAKLESLRKVAKTVWLLADCCRSAPGLRRMPTAEEPLRKGEVLAANTRDLKRGIDEGGNLILSAASDGDTPSYESDDLQHGIFTQAWLEVLRGEAPDMVYRKTARGRVLTLSGLQFWLESSVWEHSRKAGVRQRVEFPRLEGSFSSSTPVFVPAR